MSTKRILFLVDKTSSMQTFFEALKKSLVQVFSVAQLSQRLEISIVLYGDYDSVESSRARRGEQVIDVLPWTTSLADLTRFVQTTRLTWGADRAEATKTAFHRVLTMVDESVPVIHFTDAPPHHQSNIDDSDEWNMYPKEVAALAAQSLTFDWVELCRTFHERKINVFNILNTECFSTASYHVMMGTTFAVPKAATPTEITKVTIGVLLQVMGVPFEEMKQLKYQYVKGTQPERPVNELKAHGHLPGTRQEYKLHHVDWKGCEPYPNLMVNLDGLLVAFRESPEYREMVYGVFDNLFVPDQVICLTYNTVFGKLWREICKNRDDPRREVLMNKLSHCCTHMATEAEQAQLRDWVEMSYDNLEEIQAMVSKVPTYPCLVLNVPKDKLLTRKEIQEIARTSCKASDLARMMKFLSNLEVVTTESEEKKHPEVYVPLALTDIQLFKLLPHLICPGTEFSLRPAMVMAMLAYLSGNALLKDRAEVFMKAHVGKWINLKEPEKWPENFTFQFVKLVLKVGFVLTPEEAVFYEKLYKIGRLQLNAKKRFMVKVGYTPDIKGATFDEKAECSRCHEVRSTSMLTKNNICGLCLWDVGTETPETCTDEGKSWMTRCRTCKSLYAVVRKDQLNVQPSCHYCRMNTGNMEVPRHKSKKLFLCGATSLGHQQWAAPTVTCNTCANRYIRPMANESKEDFTCQVCTRTPGRGVVDAEPTFLELVQENPGLLRCFGIDPSCVQDLFSRTSLFKLRDKIQFVPEVKDVPLACNHLAVLGTAELITAMKEDVMTGSVAGDCLLCFETMGLVSLDTACGRCKNLVCQQCITTWFSQTEPGKVVLPPHLLCPFCKQTPKWKVVKKYNKRFAEMMRGGDNPFDAQWYSAWCVKCSKVKHCVERVCAQGVPDLKDLFICEPCTSKAKSGIETKPCPKCQSATSKTIGCNHITCPGFMPDKSKCGAHWCYECGKLCSEATIYDHLRRDHGGYGYGGYRMAGDYDRDYDSDYYSDEDY